MATSVAPPSGSPTGSSGTRGARRCSRAPSPPIPRHDHGPPGQRLRGLDRLARRVRERELGRPVTDLQDPVGHTRLAGFADPPLVRPGTLRGGGLGGLPAERVELLAYGGPGLLLAGEPGGHP